MCKGNPPVISGFPLQRANNEESVFMLWYHHVNITRDGISPILTVFWPSSGPLWHFYTSTNDWYPISASFQINHHQQAEIAKSWRSIKASLLAIICHNDVPWAPWHLKSLATHMFFHSLHRITNKSSKCNITGHLWGEPVVTSGSPHYWPVVWKAFPCHDTVMYCLHNLTELYSVSCLDCTIELSHEIRYVLNDLCFRCQLRLRNNWNKPIKNKCYMRKIWYLLALCYTFWWVGAPNERRNSSALAMELRLS